MLFEMNRRRHKREDDEDKMNNSAFQVGVVTTVIIFNLSNCV